MTPKDEQIAVQNDLVKKETWIIDGNYGSTMDIRLNAADTIIFLDLSRRICMYRAFKRMIQHRNQTRPDMGEGCEERFSFAFFKWIWNYPTKQKPIILNHLIQLSTNKEIIILKSPREIEEFMVRVKFTND